MSRTWPYTGAEHMVMLCLYGDVGFGRNQWPSPSLYRRYHVCSISTLRDPPRPASLRQQLVQPGMSFGIIVGKGKGGKGFLLLLFVGGCQGLKCWVVHRRRFTYKHSYICLSVSPYMSLCIYIIIYVRLCVRTSGEYAHTSMCASMCMSISKHMCAYSNNSIHVTARMSVPLKLTQDDDSVVSQVVAFTP